MSTIVYAHAGHWITGIAYAAPVFVLFGWMGVVKLRDARAQRRSGERSHETLS